MIPAPSVQFSTQLLMSAIRTKLQYHATQDTISTQVIAQPVQLSMLSVQPVMLLLTVLPATQDILLTALIAAQAAHLTASLAPMLQFVLPAIADISSLTMSVLIALTSILHGLDAPLPPPLTQLTAKLVFTFRVESAMIVVMRFLPAILAQ